MELSFANRLKHAWNVFKSRDPTDERRMRDWSYGGLDGYRPGYISGAYYSALSDKSIVTVLKNRIAVDAAQVVIQHVRLDENDRYVETIDSGLNRCLNLEANIDQTGRAFRLNIFLSLLDEGAIALVPIDTTFDPEISGTYSINNMRVGKIVEWRSKMVKVNVYNENTGLREDIIVPKKIVAIVENPFYSIMNEPNSTFQRLTHKLALLDAVDEQSSSGKLDLIIQLPYVVKTEQKRQQAEIRRNEIERQLSGSKYGIAYTDGTERIQQLNRPLENNLLGQIQYLTDLAYSQVGVTPEILNGTADEKTMLNYNNRVIEPLVAAVADSMKRTFLTKTAISQKQSIEYFRDPLALVPMDQIAEIADKLTRNEIVTSNEIRQAIGMKPSDDPNADTLRNKNLYDTTGGPVMPTDEETSEDGAEYEEDASDEETQEEPMTEEEYLKLVKQFDDVDKQLNALEKTVNSDSVSHSDDDEDFFHASDYDPERRHWYYINFEKKGLHKDYERSSTKGLNEEGRAAARYAREQYNSERNAKINAHKTQMDSNIESSKDSASQRVEASKEGMNAAIEASKANRDRMIESSKANRDRSIETRRERMKTEVESHKNQMQSRIDALKDYLKGLDKSEKVNQREMINEEIAQLRADNKAKREELSEEFKSQRNDLNELHKMTADAERQSHSSKASKLREDHKATSKQVKQEHKDTSDRLKQEHKDYSQQVRDEYKKMYEEELEQIKSQAKYQTTKKTKGSSGSKEKSTTVVYKGKKNL